MSILTGHAISRRINLQEARYFTVKYTSFFDNLLRKRNSILRKGLVFRFSVKNTYDENFIVNKGYSLKPRVTFIPFTTVFTAWFS